MSRGLAIVTTLCLAVAATAAEPDPRGHWAYRPPQRPAVPAGAHPIDALLSIERDKHGLKPLPEADRRTLIRRVYLDLIGLPPTPQEVQAFLKDQSSHAYEKVVDRLLASTRYGERWGRHWMDVWRYSDWDGYGAEVRNSQPHLWHWRDWIVESLNADKGYDRMVLEMLAGDELAPDDPDVLRATGFLARNWFLFNRNIWLENSIEHTSKAFLGLTMNCARCHEHKYDPISQKEYFEFRAIFEPHEVRLDRVPGQPDTKKDGIPRVYDAKLDAPTYLFHRGDEAKPDKGKTLPPGLPAFFGSKLKIEPVALSKTAAMPDRREFVIRETLAESEQAVVTAQTRALLAYFPVAHVPNNPLRDAVMIALSERVTLGNAEARLAEARFQALKAVVQVERLEDAGKNGGPEWQAAAIAANAAQRRMAYSDAALQLARASFVPLDSKRPFFAAIHAWAMTQSDAKAVLARSAAALKAPPATTFMPRARISFPPTSTGRRLALARWIATGENPLTARVAVNHIWLRHFGQPLVPTVFDFGINGQRPTHPELLDWLSTELVRVGWRMKPLHRLIVTSAAYRMDSSRSDQSSHRQSIDVENRYYARWSPRRLEGEAVRDSVLQVAGALDAKMGGPDIDQNLGLTVPRRSIYFRHSVEKYVEMLQVFDGANVVECYRRDESVVPQQALALANNPLVMAQSRRLGREMAAAHTAPADFVAASFERVLGRPPRPEELSACVKFLGEQARLLADPTKLTAFASGPPCPVTPSIDSAVRAREDLIHVLFNHHEFVTIR